MIGEGAALHGSGHEAGQGHRVAAHVEDPAACGVGLEETAGAAAGVEGEGGVDVGDLADRALGDELEHAHGLGVEAVHVRLEQHPLAAGGEIDQRHRGARVRGQRLLAQHVLAGLEGAGGERGVAGVHGGDVDRVDLVGGEHLVVVADQGGLGEGELLGEGAGPLQGAGADGDQDAVQGGGQLGGEAAGDRAGAEDGPAEGCGSSAHGGVIVLR